jgi:uncharacterized damage-inducible protein DinB
MLQIKLRARHFYSTTIILCILCFFSNLIIAQDLENDAFRKEFLELWDRSETYSLAVLAAADDSLLSYHPQNDMQTFAELFVHMSQTIRSLSFSYLDEERVFVVPRSALGLTNAEIREITISAFDHIRKIVNAIPDEELNQTITFFSGDEFSKRHVLRVLHSHNAHHRAQCATYLRMNGIVPPRFIGW